MARVDPTETLELIKKARKGDDSAFKKLLAPLEPELRRMARQLYIRGSDEEDVVQEGRLGVWKAVQDFNPEGGMSFKNFAITICVRRHLITAISSANRNKYKLQNDSSSLEQPIHFEDDADQTLKDFIQDFSPPMLDGIAARADFEKLAKKLKPLLTQMELAVFNEYTKEESYKDIAEALGMKVKSVDNTISRLRGKSKLVYMEYNYNDDINESE